MEAHVGAAPVPCHIYIVLAVKTMHTCSPTKAGVDLRQADSEARNTMLASPALDRQRFQPHI